MAILHFLMTSPKWSIGLFLFLAGHTSPIQSPSNAIREPVSQLRALVEMESQSYQTCIDHSWKRKQNQLRDVALHDRSNILELRKRNEQKIRQAQNDVETCLEKTQKARDMLVQWRNDGMTIPWTVPISTNNPMVEVVESSSLCSASDREDVETLLGQDFGLVEDQLSKVMEDYVGDSERSLEVVHTYALARFQYDYEYFVGLKIQPALDYLANLDVNIESLEIDLQVDLDGLRTQIELSLTELNSMLTYAKEHIDILHDKLKEFVDVIDALYDNYSDAYDRLQRVIEFINDAVPDIVELPPFLNVDNLPIPDSLLPASFYWPRPSLDLEDIRTRIDEAADAYLLIVQNLLGDLRKLASVQLHGHLKDVFDDLVGILELKDYDPPQFQGSIGGISSMAQQLNFQGIRGEQMLNWTTDYLGNIRNKASDISFTGDNITAPNVSSIDYSYVEDSTEFSYLEILIPDISFPEFFQTIVSWFLNNTWILEILIQAYRLFKLEATYIRGAIPQLPEIDYGDHDGESDEDDNFKTKYMILMFVIKSFLTPRMICFVVFLPLVIVSIAFWFPHVHQSCVQSNDGTFIANNFLTPLMINQANAWGNVQFLHAEFQCQQTQRQWCTEVATEAETWYQTDVTAIHGLEIQNNKTAGLLETIGHCIDADQMTPLVQKACCGLKGYTTVTPSGSATCFVSPEYHEGNSFDQNLDLVCPIDVSTNPPSAFSPLETYLREESCHRHHGLTDKSHGATNDWTLIDTRYNCSGLVDVCLHIPCAGADEDLIRQQTINADCQVEMYAIDVCYFLLALFVHAITINIVFTLIFNGIRQIRWRTLSPDGVRLRTQLRENGQLAKGYDMIDRSNRITKAVRRFEMMGKLQIGLGSVVLLVYFIGTMVFILK